MIILRPGQQLELVEAQSQLPKSPPPSPPEHPSTVALDSTCIPTPFHVEAIRLSASAAIMLRIIKCAPLGLQLWWRLQHPGRLLPMRAPW